MAFSGLFVDMCTYFLWDQFLTLLMASSVVLVPKDLFIGLVLLSKS